MPNLLLVVEGHGELEAAPVLVRRIFNELFGEFDVDIDVQRRRCLAHLRANEWSNFKRYLAAAFNEGTPILWILDADDECAVDCASEMVEIANLVGLRQPFAVAFWIREWETMFLYDWVNLRSAIGAIGQNGPPADPEQIRGAKEWITAQLPKNVIYKETVDQTRLSARVSIEFLRERYRSFRHFCNVLEWLIDQQSPDTYPINVAG